MTFWITQAVNGISFGMLLFLLAAGLSLVHGLLRVLNLAHGSYYAVGAYVGLSVVRLTDSFVLAGIAGTAAVTLLGILMERLFLRRFPKHLSQVLLTFGFLFIFADLSLWTWGGAPQTLPKPELFSASIRLGDVVIPSYRLFVIATGVVVGIGLWWFQERTRLGSMVRAGVDDSEMARGMGVNVPLLSTAVFGLGAFLAGLGGIIGGPFVGVHPGVEFEVLLLAMVVVIVGGLGSLKGAFFGGLLIGVLDNFGRALFPELALFTVFAPMAIILAVRPTGLFGRR